jgi:hypothetical protein
MESRLMGLLLLRIDGHILGFHNFSGLGNGMKKPNDFIDYSLNSQADVKDG